MEADTIGCEPHPKRHVRTLESLSSACIGRFGVVSNHPPIDINDPSIEIAALVWGFLSDSEDAGGRWRIGSSSSDTGPANLLFSNKKAGRLFSNAYLDQREWRAVIVPTVKSRRDCEGRERLCRTA